MAKCYLCNCRKFKPRAFLKQYWCAQRACHSCAMWLLRCPLVEEGTMRSSTVLVHRAFRFRKTLPSRARSFPQSARINALIDSGGFPFASHHNAAESAPIYRPTSSASTYIASKASYISFDSPNKSVLSFKAFPWPGYPSASLHFLYSVPCDLFLGFCSLFLARDSQSYALLVPSLPRH